MGEPTRKKETDLIDYWNIIWRRKILLIALFLVSVIGTAIVSFQLPKYYKSEAMIIAIAPESGGLGAALSASPLAGALAGSIGGFTTPADKILVFLKSRTIADMVIRKFDLLHVFNKDKWDAARGTWKNPEKPPLMEDTVKELGKEVTTFKKSREGTITIAVEWKDPKLAADLANYYVVALAEFMKDKSVNTTVQIIDPAVPAEKKSSPKIRQNVIVAGVLSSLIGFFLALYLESLSNRKKS
ncbi:MAG TPA: Wzz/FepE/Etk N-terminal domain-containing protein [Nitrospirota bacterium]|nr:Wzz/FepE/Etk N-terminal domain-containing protein [Nitrospirota bacterium]